jgi:glycosyltransferase involved in cell wall biosynthesis
MIVKNESHIIENTLSKLCDKIAFSYWVICDTGSTDDTREIITRFFSEKNIRNIPGELIQHEWKDFGHNRTLALEAAHGKADYIFIFDADDQITGEIEWPITFDKPAYNLQFGSTEFSYVRPILLSGHLKTRYVGVLHESLEYVCHVADTIGGNYFIESLRTGSRNNDHSKYFKDAMILQNAYASEKDVSLADRYAFYCAQSYRDCDLYDDAVEWYLKVVNSSTSCAQEKYCATVEIGKIHKTRNLFENALLYFMKSQQFDSHRIEGIALAMEMLREHGHHYLVTLLYESNYKYKIYNLSNKLFVVKKLYNDFMEFNCSISSYYCNKRDLSYLCTKLIIGNNVAQPDILYANFENLQFFEKEISEEADASVVLLYSRLSDFLKSYNGKVTKLYTLHQIMAQKLATR